MTKTKLAFRSKDKAKSKFTVKLNTEVNSREEKLNSAEERWSAIWLG